MHRLSFVHSVEGISESRAMEGSGAPWREFLVQLGIDPTTAMAGFSGAVVNVLFMKVKNAMSVTATAVSGTLIAVYLGDPISKAVNFLPAVATAFLVGYLGVLVLEKASSILRDRINGTGSVPKSGG